MGLQTRALPFIFQRRTLPPVSRIKKAISKILEGRSDANFGFDDLCFVLDRAGFTPVYPVA